MNKINRRSWLLGNAAGLGGLTAALQTKPQTPSREAPSACVIFPCPQSVEFGSRRVQLTQDGRLNASVAVAESAGAAGQTAGRMIAAELKRRTGQEVPVSGSASSEGFRIEISPFDSSSSGQETETEGGYRLRVTPQAAVLAGRDAGILNAAASFNQLLQGWNNPHLTEVTIRDWPEIPWRGIFAEVGCVAAMELQDWKDFIDLAARLKLNAINVGLYNCWQRSLALGLDVEFFLFPSRRYPQFKTFLNSSYYSYKEQRQIDLNEVPPIYREDFLGQVVAYGKERGVEVSPYFTSLSHNTLIPKLMPEISMKDSNCRPIGYGFCTTCPKTYEVLFNLYDEIIDRYARPYSITTFHVGMDETRHVCQCPDCRVAWNGVNDFYVDHLIKIVRRLKDRGMTRVLVWHDMLHRLGLINKDLEARFKAAGIDDMITLCWWYYSAPQGGDSLYAHDSFGKAFFRPPSDIDAWASPSAGWDTLKPLGASLPTQNIALYDLLRQGKDRRSTGTLSYSMHDPIFIQGYINLAQYSWNQKPSLAETQSRFRQWLFGEDDGGEHGALQLYQNAYTTYAALVDAFYNRSVPSTFGRAAASVGKGASREGSFRQAMRDLDDSAKTLRGFQAGREDPEKARLIAAFLAEVRRLQTFIGAAYAVLKCNTTYDQFRDRLDSTSLDEFERAVRQLRTSIQEHATALRGLEETRYWASLVRFMVYETRAHENMKDLDRLYSGLLERARAGNTDYLPEVEVAGMEFVGTDLGMVLPEKT